MPLPKPPASRATILPNTAYESQAAPRSPRSSPKHSNAEQAERAPALELRDDAPPGAAPALSGKGLPTKAPSKAAPKVVA